MKTQLFRSGKIVGMGIGVLAAVALTSSTATAAMTTVFSFPTASSMPPTTGAGGTYWAPTNSRLQTPFWASNGGSGAMEYSPTSGSAFGSVGAKSPNQKSNPTFMSQISGDTTDTVYINYTIPSGFTSTANPSATPPTQPSLGFFIVWNSGGQVAGAPAGEFGWKQPNSSAGYDYVSMVPGTGTATVKYTGYAPDTNVADYSSTGYLQMCVMVNSDLTSPIYINSVSVPEAVPEPATGILLGVGATAGLLLTSRRKRVKW